MKIKTIYELLNEYSKRDIDNAIKKLSKEEQNIIKLRYGTNLNEPKTSSLWNSEYSKIFYNKILSHIKKLIKEEDKEQSTFINSSNLSNDIFEKLLDFIENDLSIEKIRKELDLSNEELYRYLNEIKKLGH